MLMLTPNVYPTMVGACSMVVVGGEGGVNISYFIILDLCGQVIISHGGGGQTEGG